MQFALVHLRELFGLSSLNPKKIDLKMHFLRVLYNLVSSDIREMAFMHSLVVCGNRLGAIMVNDTIFFSATSPHENKSYDLYRYVGLLMCTPGCLSSLNTCLFNAVYIVQKY